MIYGWKDWGKCGFHHGRDEYDRLSRQFMRLTDDMRSHVYEPDQVRKLLEQRRQVAEEMNHWYKPWWRCSGVGPYRVPDGTWDVHIQALLG